MAVLVLVGLLVLVVGGCVCVVWAARGGPRWVRVVGALTLGAGELLSSRTKRAHQNSGQNLGGGSDS
ncbi:hypothetical protein [Streptomyces sp. NPDC056468]|uniref:hypothetical protein n=1 Tax=Streptomyces sp. NPDC056468 TaxID=3345830 RepID=UPI0036AD091C